MECTKELPLVVTGASGDRCRSDWYVLLTEEKSKRLRIQLGPFALEFLLAAGASVIWGYYLIIAVAIPT